MSSQSSDRVVIKKGGDLVKRIQVFTDGSSFGNPGKGGYGHVTEKMKKDSADRMQAFIESL